MQSYSISDIYQGMIVPNAVIAPLLIALYQYKRLSVALRLFTIYLLLSGLGNVVSVSLANQNINNLPPLHLYTLVEFLVISGYYKLVLGNVAVSRRINFIMIAFTIFCIVNAIFIQSIYSYNTYPRSAGAIVIIIYTLIYFKNALDNVSASANDKKGIPYINGGFLLYFGSSFFLFITANMFRPYYYLNTVIWDIHATLVLIMYALFTVGLAYAKRDR